MKKTRKRKTEFQRPKWEYKIFETDTIDDLNRLGADGWEWCESTSASRALFKRQVDETDEWNLPNVPYFWVDEKNPTVLMRRLNGIVQAGSMVDGLFIPSEWED